MKRSILLNAMVLMVAVMGISFTAQSQVYVLSTAPGQSRDSVTVGSRAGYRVTPDPTIVALSAIMNPSIYQWAFSSATPILKPDGTAATLVSPGFYSDTAISGVMPAAAGTITVSVLERSQPKVGTSCDGGTITMNIDVLPRATITFTGTGNGACSAQAYNIPVNLTGFGPWTVEYSITYTPFLGVPSAPVTYLIVGGTGGAAATLGTASNVGPVSLNLPILAAQLGTGLQGTYAVNIISVYDRFAMKSLDLTLVKSIPAELPAAAFDLFIYPTPTTSPIQHVKNM